MQVSLLSECGSATIPTITVGRSLFARSFTRSHLGPIARALARRVSTSRKEAEATSCNGRAYPVHDGTRGAFHPPCP
jgi:hypothetical protein